MRSLDLYASAKKDLLDQLVRIEGNGNSFTLTKGVGLLKDWTLLDAGTFQIQSVSQTMKVKLIAHAMRPMDPIVIFQVD